jgi:RimJ/RimL family protein N-acetyltransferase
MAGMDTASEKRLRLWRPTPAAASLTRGAGVAHHREGASALIGIELVVPSLTTLPDYVAALKTGWSPNTERNVAEEELAAIKADPVAALREIAKTEGAMRRLPDGTEAAWLPGKVLWIWDGSLELPPHVSGHVGYAVVPWKRRRGYATEALRRMLPIARDAGLRRLSAICDADNIGSRKVIEANAGILENESPSQRQPGQQKLRFWIELRT